ncbi:MAG: DUF4116 domain-containing protein, partial [Pseudomonadota bacterium]
PRFRDDEETVCAVVSSHWGALALEHASERLHDNESIVMAAVQRNADAFGFASARLRDNDDIVLAAVQKDASALGNASERLQDNEGMVWAAISHYAVILHHKTKTGSSSRLVNKPSTRPRQ